jgi:hypothetical protein
MAYQLKQWAVYKIDTPMNTRVAKFKKRTDADEYLKILRRNTPYKFEVIFE